MNDQEAVSPLRVQAMTSLTETVKLLVTLASGVLALSGTFAEKLVGDAPPWALSLLYLSWLALIISILFGILTLYSIADSQHSDRKNWWTLATPRLKQCYRTFLGGIAMLVLFAAIGTGTRSMRPSRRDGSPVAEVKGPAKIVYSEPHNRCQETIPKPPVALPPPQGDLPATGAADCPQGSQQ